MRLEAIALILALPLAAADADLDKFLSTWADSRGLKIRNQYTYEVIQCGTRAALVAKVKEHGFECELRNSLVIVDPEKKHATFFIASGTTPGLDKWYEVNLYFQLRIWPEDLKDEEDKWQRLRGQFMNDWVEHLGKKGGDK